jgi:4-aminobutyrate aminotransferase
LRCAEFIDYVMQREGDIGALIAEPIRCTAVNLPPPAYWAAVREICHRHGALLIFDETASCLGRTGRMFACEHFDIVPDILTLGKGLGGGILPLAAIVAREDLDVAKEKALGHYTHEKNPVLCAAALATIDFIQKQDLIRKTTEHGYGALAQLKELRENHPLVGDVRSLGLLMAIELVRDRLSKKPALEEAEKVMYKCLEKGLSFKVSQGNILNLMPPLTISPEELVRGLKIIDQALTEVEQ